MKLFNKYKLIENNQNKQVSTYRKQRPSRFAAGKKACLKEKQIMSGERGERKSTTNCLCERPFPSQRIEGMFVECFSLHLVYAHDSSTQTSVQNLTSVKRLGQNEVPGKSFYKAVRKILNKKVFEIWVNLLHTQHA